MKRTAAGYSKKVNNTKALSDHFYKNAKYGKTGQLLKCNGGEWMDGAVKVFAPPRTGPEYDCIPGCKALEADKELKNSTIVGAAPTTDAWRGTEPMWPPGTKVKTKCKPGQFLSVFFNSLYDCRSHSRFLLLSLSL